MSYGIGFVLFTLLLAVFIIAAPFIWPDETP